MVYGGKPSRGCRTCRARRIKCDEGKPTCMRCARSKRECGGYRPEFEIVHRDQTGSTLRRLRRKTTEVKEPQPSRNRPYVFVQEELQACGRFSPSPSPEATLTVPLVNRAWCHFASNFILMPLGVAPHGFMDYLVPLMESDRPGSALHHAFYACAFALLGNRARADGVDLGQLSLKEHTLALAQTHKALGDPVAVTADSTLAAVLMLCLYESITAVKESRMLAWRTHIDGAVQILKTRRHEQISQTRIGALLFTAVRHHLVSRSLSSGIPLPFGADWWMSGGDTQSLFATCQRFALSYSEVRTDATRLMANRPRDHKSIEDMREIANRVQRLDNDIAQWLATIPEQFRFKTVCRMSEDDVGLSRGLGYADLEVFPGRVDTYPDFVTAMAWNLGRVSRLLLNSLHIRVTAWICSPVDYRTTPIYSAAKRICEETIVEVSASVPYHLGWQMNGESLGRAGLSAFACGEEGTFKALPALFLIWSLTCIKNHDMSSEVQRAWARGRLRFIADEVGLKYAHLVNQVDIRFPSMMIRQDGQLASVDPLQTPGESGFYLRPTFTPETPESLGSVNKSPPPD
ncbi:hypothetical protein VTI74DRAFT_2327 [Chaetomium olivicolor]